MILKFCWVVHNVKNEYDVDDHCSKISTVPVFAYTVAVAVTCFDILNVHVQQVKSCIVTQVLTLRGF